MIAQIYQMLVNIWAFNTETIFKEKFLTVRENLARS